MTSEPESNGLLGVPRKIRNCIYEMVLLSENKAPESPSDNHHFNYLLRSNAGGLLACNHQLRQEIIEAIAHLNNLDAGLHYKINVITWNSESQVTWLWVPAPPKYISQITVTSRIPLNAGWEPPCPTGRALFRGIILILDCLTHFFDDSPSFRGHPSRNARPCRSLHVEKLLLNVEFMHVKSKPKGDHTGFQWYPAERSKTEKERFHAHLCRLIGLRIRSDMLYGVADQLTLRYDQNVTVWQLPEGPEGFPEGSPEGNNILENIKLLRLRGCKGLDC